MTRAKDISKIVTDADLSGTLDVTGAVTVGGNVGIGTSSNFTDAKLHVKNVNGGGDTNLRIQNASTTTGTTTSLKFTNTTSDYAHVSLISDRDRNLIFKNTDDTVETMRIDSSGNVGINTTSPGQKLQVDGFIRSYDSSTTGIGFQLVNSLNSWNIQTTTGVEALLFVDNTRAEAMRIDSSGNVGIGTSSPATKLAVSGSIAGTGALNISGGGWGVQPYVANSLLIDNYSGQTRFFATGADATTDGSFLFYTSQTDGGANERMRIDSSGNILFNTTTLSDGSNNSMSYSNTGDETLIISSAGTGGSYMIRFMNGNGVVGQIISSGSSTSYSTTSDHRLKENVTADWDATTRLKQLNPVRFNFIADADTTVDGFLAHEVQSVVPEAITGTHNEVQVWKDGEELPDGVSVGDNKLDEDGNTIPVYQGIDQSKLVPLLVKTIQELEARIVALETA